MPPGLLYTVIQCLSCTTATEPKCFVLLYTGELLVTLKLFHWLLYKYLIYFILGIGQKLAGILKVHTS